MQATAGVEVTLDNGQSKVLDLKKALEEVRGTRRFDQQLFLVGKVGSGEKSSAAPFAVMDSLHGESFTIRVKRSVNAITPL